MTPADREKFEYEKRKDAATAAATAATRGADDKRADESNHAKRIDDLVKSWATSDGKLDTQRYAQLQKYAGQFDRGNMTPEDHLRSLMDNYAVDALFDTEGRHLLTPESPSAGEGVLPQTGPAGWMGALAHGRMGGQTAYTDPLTGRRIYQSDVERTLSPNQKAILAARTAKLQAAQKPQAK